MDVLRAVGLMLIRRVSQVGPGKKVLFTRTFKLTLYVSAFRLKKFVKNVFNVLPVPFF